MPPRILIVDDDHTLADVLSVALRRAGYEARVAYDGQRALQILHQEPFDLVLLDVIMPNMDGLEVCKRIRSDPQISHVLVLLFTALTLRAEMRDARKSGADGFITKPAVVREVVLRIQALLARGQTGRETLGPIVAFIGVKGGVGGWYRKAIAHCCSTWAVQDSPPVGHWGWNRLTSCSIWPTPKR